MTVIVFGTPLRLIYLLSFLCFTLYRLSPNTECGAPYKAGLKSLSPCDFTSLIGMFHL